MPDVLATNARLPVTQWRAAIQMAPGVQLAVAGWVPRAPKAIALVSHGYREHLGRYGHVVASLVADGIAVYGPDHYGHGRSTGTRALVTDFDRIADHLHVLAHHARSVHPGLPTVLIGHSMGGLIVLHYMLKYQDELVGLVTVSPALIIEQTRPWPVGETVHRLGPVVPRALIPSRQHPGCDLSTDESICAWFDIDHRTWHEGARLGAVAAMIGRGDEILHRLGELHLPLLAMHGTADPVASPRGTELLHAGASSEDKTLVMWQGRKHELFSSPGRIEAIATLRLWLAERFG